MKRTNRFAKNVIFSAIAQIITMICGFIVPKIMLNYYGSEINGLVTSITQVMTYIALIEGGLSGASIFALYKPIADNDTKQISLVVSTSKSLYKKAGYIGLMVSIIVGVCYPLVIKTNLLSYQEIFFLFIIIACTTILDFFILGKYRALLSANQDEYILSISTMIQIIVNALCVSLFSYLGFNIVIVRLIALSSLLARVLVIYIACKKKYKDINFKENPNYNLLDKRKDALVMQILNAVHRGSPILIATILLSLNDVSIYSVYNLVVTGIASILSIFMNGLQASFGDVIARKEWDILEKAYSQFELAYFLLITILYSVTYVTIIPFIKVYIGESDINYIFPLIGSLFTLNGYLYSLKNPQGMIVIAGGLYKETKIQSMIQAIICVFIGFIGCYFIGIPGILIGRLCSNIYRDIEIINFIPKTYSVIKKKRTIMRWLIYFTSFVIIVIVSNFIPNYWINNYLNWVLYAIIITLINSFILISITFMFFRRDVFEIIKRLKKLVVNR